MNMCFLLKGRLFMELLKLLLKLFGYFNAFICLLFL